MISSLQVCKEAIVEIFFDQYEPMIFLISFTQELQKADLPYRKSCVV